MRLFSIPNFHNCLNDFLVYVANFFLPINAYFSQQGWIRLKGIIWDNICGISTNLIDCVIFVLLVAGGIEINPGPPRKDSNSSSEEDIQVPKSFDFGETSQGIHVFSAPITPILKMQKRRVLVSSKNCPKIFRGHIKREEVAISPENSPVPTTSSQTSVTESLDVLELSAEVPRISVETQNDDIPFLDRQ